MSSDRWLELARELREELPGEWSLRGPDYWIRLVREPMDWTITWIHYDDYKHVVYASILPLMERFSGWNMRYGILTEDLQKGPRHIDINDPEGPKAIKDFIFGNALQELDDWPLKRIADVAEIDLDSSPESRSTYWLAAPGCRVILDRGSPVEPAQRVIEHFGERRPSAGVEGIVGFHSNLIEAWRSGGRPAARRFLEKNRQTIITEQGMDQVHV